MPPAVLSEVERSATVGYTYLADLMSKKADKAEQHINHHSQQTEHSGVLRNSTHLISVDCYTKRQSAELRRSQQVLGGTRSRSDRLVPESGLEAKL